MKRAVANALDRLIKESRHDPNPVSMFTDDLERGKEVSVVVLRGAATIEMFRQWGERSGILDRTRDVDGSPRVVAAEVTIETYIVQLERDIWLADWEGDPGRTLNLDSAKVFLSKAAAERAIEEARVFRPFTAAEVQPRRVRQGVLREVE